MTRNRPSLPRWSPRRLTMALEPRHLFDGAAPAEVAAAVQDDGPAAVRDAPAVAPVEARPSELIVVDSRLAQSIDVEKLRAATAKVVLLDQQSDGLAQLAAALDGEQNLTAIHILSHGSRDGIFLGQGLVDQNELQRQGAVLAGIGSALAADGDILLYGCDVAADNREFVDTLSALTQADVAASTNATGSAALGGDWLLEASTGPLETTAFALADFAQLLAPPTIVDGGGTRATSEDTPLAITGISIADADVGDTQTVTLAVTGGTITLQAGSGATIAGDGTATVIFSGTLTQVTDALNGMSFAPTADYFGPASIAASTDDGTTSVGPTDIALTVTPLDDLPVGTADAIAATEDAGAVIGDLLANDINLDAPIDTLSVIALRTGTVVAGSGTAGSVGNPLVGTYGSLTVNATGAYSYTVDNSLATVQALMGGQTVSENFTYALSDGHTSVQTDITVTVTGSNDAPEVVGMPAVLIASSIPEDASSSENPGTLLSTLLADVDGNPVVGDVDAGTVLGIAIYGSSITNGMSGVWQYSLDNGASWTPAAAFSSSDALLLPADAKLRFVADSNTDDAKESGVASIQYYVWDGSDGASAGNTVSVSARGGITPFSTASLDADFIVSARNDVPTVAPVSLVLNEGSTATITVTELPVVDQDNQSDQLTYRVDVLPSRGVLLKSGIPLSVGSVFTELEVLAGKLSYRHTSGELSADASDSVSFSLRDGAGGEIDPVVLPITIRDVNAPITITGTTQIVPERIGSEASDFAELNLGLSDTDGDPSRMTLTITRLRDAAAGRLQYWNGSSYVDVTVGLSMSKAELLANPLHFISSGAEPAPVSGSDFAGPYRPNASFDVIASDNNATLAPTTDSTTITLTIEARNDAPTPVTQLLHVDQGGPAVAITQAFLTGSDPDSDAAKRLYTVNSFPGAGLLRLSGVIIGVGATFTEADLNAGLLTYTHDGGTTDSNSATAEDHFDFSINDGDAAVSIGRLEIDVRPDTPTVPDGRGTLRAITPEGSFTAIDTATLTGSTSYTLSLLPTHGNIYLNGVALRLGGVFSAADLAAGAVVYVNNGNEPSAYDTTYQDAFEVSRSGGTVSGASTIALIVTPVDDAPSIGQSVATVGVDQDGNPLMEESAVSGSSDFNLTGVTNAVKLTLDNLQHVDPDSDPTALSYVLETAPLGGELRHWHGATWVALEQEELFSALDVENGNIAYFHSAASELRTDSITVHLRDGGVVQVGDVLIAPPLISEQAFVTVDDGSNSLAINKGEIARSPSRTVTFEVANVNDAPLASNGIFTVEEGYNTGMGGADNNPGRIQILDASLLAASDSDNSLSTATYTIASLPVRGSLEIDRGSGFVALVAGEEGTAAAQFDYAMLTGGQLRYVQDGSESVVDGFTWRLNDNSLVAPLALDSNLATVVINILPQNDPPVIFNNTGATIANGKAVPEGGVLYITEDMLGSPLTADTDVDNTRRQTQFRVTAATQSGTLYLDKAGVITVLGVDASFTLGDIQGDLLHPEGYLKYRHNGAEMPPSDSFGFEISDGSGGNEPVGTFNIEIRPVNDAPQLSGLNPLTYFEDDGATLIDTSVLFNDVDLANGASYNAGTMLTIAYTSGGTVGDQLSVRNQGTAPGQVSVAGSAVSYNFAAGPVQVGTIDGSLDGGNGANLRITFNASANVVAVKAVLENLSFQNTDTGNASQNTAQATRSLSYTFVDGGGTDVYIDDAGTTLRGADTVIASNTILVTQRNDAPVMTDGDTVLTPISEDETVNGRSVSVLALLGGSSDVDNAAVSGIAISNLVAGNGSWQYSLDSTDGSDGSWSNVGSLSVNSSLLLRPTDWVRFIPNGQNATAADFTYRAWDQTTGSFGGRANTSLSGGTTAFSSEDNVVSLVVTSVNDAPALADTALAMTETEDAGVPGVGAGTLISDLVGGISDVDSGAQQGLAIIGANAAQGTWHFSIDAGTNWQQLGAPLPGDAVLLAADALTRIYFEPNANYNGVQAAALTVRAWDQTSGSNGATSGIDTTVNGTTTAFSTATDTVSLTVLALNDAPTISNNTLVIDTGGASENTKIALGSIFTLGEIDLARFEGSNLGQLTLSVPHGAFVLDTTGVSVTAGSQASDRGAGDWGGGTGTLTFTGTLAQLQSALNTVEYVPGDNPDSSETITVTFNDLNNAGAGAASGGSDVHSASASVDILNIAPVNDAPTISRPATVSATEDVQFNFNGGNTISIADVDARNGIVQVALSIPTGTITLTQGATAVTGGSLGSSTFTLQGTVSEINGALATLKYTSALDDNSLNVNDADRTLAIAVSDLGNSLGGNPLTTTTPGTANASTLINLAAVNDTPTLDVDPAGGVQATRATTTVGENATTAISDIILADSSDISDSGYGSNTNIAVTALHGTLTLDASTGVVAVPSGSPSGRSLTLTGSIADINAAIVASHLKYTPDSNFSGNDNLHLVFHDAGNSGSGGDMSALADIPLLVSGVNDAPGFVGLGGGSVGFTEDGAPVVLDVDATLTDPELAGYDNWGGAILTVQRTAAVGNPGSAVTDDVFGVTGSGSVGVNFIGNNVRIGTNIVGSVDTSTGGVLTIEFDDTTTTAQANLVLQALTYSNSNDNPPTQVTIGYTINDGNDNTGLTAQGSGNPLALEGSGSVVVDIAATNDAPVLTLGAGPMDQFFEDGAASQLAPNAVLSDPELSFLASGNGDWGSAILSLQGSSGPDPEDVFGVTGNGAIGVNFNGSDLRIGTRVVGTFSNAGGAFSVIFTAGTATAEVEQVTQALTYRNTRQSLADGQVDILNQLLWTINDGNTGDNVTAGPQGLGGAEEAAVTQDITLRGANDAPVLADTVLAITVPEDNALPMAAVGTVLSALIGGASDVDASAVYGVAIIDSDTTMGTWFYSINGGSTWLDVGVVAENSALLLRDSDRLYFQPNLDSNGTLAPAPGLFGLKLRAWDQTGSTASAAGTKVNVSSIGIGDTTPFSTATDTVALTVIAINDAPTRLLASVDLADSLEDAASPSQETIANLFDGAGSHAAFSDTKDDQTAFTGGSVANLFVGIVITDNAATAAQGTWQYSADGIGAWSNISTALTSASGLFLPGTYTLRFQAAADWNGTPGSLSVRLADNSVGVLPAAEDSVDVSNDTTLSGAGTRYSNSSNAVSLGTSITSVNDAPAGADKTITAIEDIAYQFQAADFGFTDVHDNPANNLASVLISALPVTGTLKLSGTALTVPQSISVADIANLTWAPPPDLNGSAVASFTFQVGDDGGVLNGGIDTDTSANTITFDVSAVVDIVGDSQTTAEETAVTTNLLSNDNFEGSPLVTGVTQGAHGTVVNNNDGTVTYTPDADYNGSDSYTYTVTSPAGVTETATVTVTINPVVDVVDDVAVTDEDTAVTTDVLANDNFEGSPLVTGVTQGAHGTVVNNNDGTVTYTPDADYNGSDSYTYTVTSPTGVTETATVIVTINPIVDIADDVAVTDEDAAVTTDVLANDNFEGSPLVTGVTQGAHGTVVNNNDGTVTYTPDADYNGSDSYTYTVTSPTGVTETATVNVTINPIVDIVDDVVVTDEDTAVTTNVLANDNFAGSPLVTGVTQGAHGTVVNNNDGTVTYIPDADYNGSDSYTYTVTSPVGITETATVNVTINPVADIADDTQTTDEDSAVTTNVLANDNFEGSPVVSAVTQGAHGTVVNNNDGTVTYTPDADYNGSDSYTYTVTSPTGVTETATVTVTINSVVDIADDNEATDEDTAVTTDVLANDNFAGSPLVTGVTQGAHGTVVNNNDGTVTYTPDADYNGSDSYTYTVTSPTGVTETATVIVTINPIVDIADDTQTTDEDSAVTTDVVANDNFEGSPLVTGVTQGAHGTVVINNDGTVTYTPDADYNGSDSYTYTVTSPAGVTETATVNVTINPVADIADDTQTTDEDTAVTTDVLANDNFEGSPVVSAVTQGAHGTVVNNNDGTVTYTPDADYNGSDSYTYTVTSPVGITETATVNVTINPVADIADDTQTTDEDTAVTTDVLANDNFEGSPVVSAVTQGAHGTVVNNNDGTVTYTPDADYNGSDSYTYTVTSPVGITETATVNVTINPVADIADDTQTTDEDTAVTTDVLANDNFEGSPVVSAVTQGAHGTVVNNNDGTVTYTPAADYNGSDSYTYTVTSAAGVTETATVTVTINPVVDVVDDVAVTDEDFAVTTDVLANDNFEGSTLVTGVTQGAHGTVVNNNDGTVTYTPDADYNGSDSYTYTVTSPAGVTETATVTVTINPIVDIADDIQTTDEDTAVTTNVLANDNFEGSPLVTGVTQGAHGTVVNNNDGTVTYTPDADYNGSDSYTYTVTSPAGVAETSTVNVTINPIVDIVDDVVVTDEDTAVTTYVLANDNFEGSPLVTGVTQGAHGTVVNNNDGTVTYTPDADYNGSDSYTYTVTSPAGVAETSTVNVTINPIVDIVDDVVVTDEDTAVTTYVLANDNFEGSPLVTGVTQGAHGTVVNNNDGTVTYTPDADYNGSDSYTYTVTSPAGVAETATVNVTINPIVDIVDDVVVTDEDTAVTTNVLANDNFAGSPLVTGVTQGAHGTVVNNNDGTVTYIPDADYNGSDSYTYTVTSPVGITETATVNVTINPVADIADDTQTTDEDSAVTTNVLANDNFEGSPVVSAVTQGAHGTVVNNNDGTVTYTPDADYNGSDSYTYTVTSPTGVTETATVTVTINSVVDIADDNEATDEDTAVTTDVLANDNFAGSPLVTGVTQGAHGTVVNNNDGTVTYTPDADYNGSDSYTYTVTSPTGVTETATVIVTINPIVDIADDTQTTDEDSAVTTDVVANDNFEGSPLVTGVTQGAHGTVVINNDGTVTYTPDADYNGSDSYTYTVTSPAGVTETATVNVTINPVADIADDTQTTDEDTAVTTDVLANDNFEGSPVVSAVTQGAHGTVVNNNDGTVTYTPDADYNGSDSYTYTVTSPVGITETATVNVTINPVADIADDTQTTDEDTAVTTDVLANDNFEGSPVVSAVTQGAHGTVVNNNDGTVTYTPDADYNGSDSYTYTVTSPVGITETATVNVTINPVADIADDTQTTDEDTAVTTDVLANDNFEGSPVVSAVTQGAHGTVVNNNDGTVTYTPAADYNGSDSYTYTVTSAAGVTETATVTVTINPVVDVVDDVAVTDEDFAVTTDVLANDNFEGSTLVTGVTQGAHGTVVNNNDGTVTYTPDADYNGSDSYTYTVTSPAGVTETATVNVTINPIVDIADDTQTTDEDSAVTTNVLANDNFEGSPLVTGVTQGAHGTVVNNNDGTVTYTPDADYNGSDSYTYTVTSPAGVAETATVNVTINPIVDIVDDVVVTDEDTAVTTNVLANDNFAGSPLVTGVTQGAHGTVVNNNDGTVTYTPDADYNGSDSYTYTVTSPVGITETATVNVTINPVADIADDTQTTDEDTAVTTDVLANDNFEGSPLVTGVTQGAHGTVVNNNDGTVTYTPDADYNGSDSYTYTVTSPAGVAETSTVNVTINPIVDIVDDVVVTDEDTAVTTYVLANDNFEGSPLVTGVTQGAHGTVVNNNDGTVTYTPDADYNGSDSYTYTVTSPIGITETATVTVTINPIVDIADDIQTTDEDTAVTTNVLANDNFEGSPVVSAVTQGAHGTVVNNNDGTVTYTPDADYNGSDSYTYTVTSPAGISETATVTVTINPIVDIADDLAVTDEEAAVTTDVLANDNFEGSPLVTGVTQGTHGTVVNNNDGTVTYTPDADYNGSDSYTYTVTSPVGITETATVTVTINPVVDIVDDTEITDEGSAVTTDVLANDNFEGSPLVTGVTQGAHGTVVNNNDGTVTYTPDADYNGSDSYTYTVTSPAGVAETSTVNVTINPIVDIVDDVVVTDEDTAVTTYVLANDNFEGSPLVTGVTQGAHGTVVNNNDGTVTYTPDADYNGSDSYTYTVTSPIGITETATVTVTINPIVDIADDIQTTDEDTAVTTDVLANDNFEGSPLVTGVTQGAHGTVVNNNDGTVTYTLTRTTTVATAIPTRSPAQRESLKPRPSTSRSTRSSTLSMMSWSRTKTPPSLPTSWPTTTSKAARWLLASPKVHTVLSSTQRWHRHLHL
jgi:VCBS repeat-containing protein